MKSSNIESEKGCYKEAEKRVLARRKAKQKQEQRWNACVKQNLTLSKTAFVTSFLKQIIETTVWKVEDDSPNIINAENV